MIELDPEKGKRAQVRERSMMINANVSMSADTVIIFKEVRNVAKRRESKGQ